MTAKTKAPTWFTIVAVVLLLWAMAGIGSFYVHVAVGPDGMEGATEYDRRMYAALPGWFNTVFGVAVWGGLFGAIGLLARSRWAIWAFAASLIAAVVQFGWMFLATDLIAAKGAAETVPFPVFIIAVAAVQLWLALRARDRGWIA